MKPFKTYDEQIKILQSRHLLPQEDVANLEMPKAPCFEMRNKPDKLLIPLIALREIALSRTGITDAVKELLQTYGYYNIINQYNKPFIAKDGAYQPHIDFFMLYSLQQIDIRMKNIIFSPILQAEQRLKTCISYEFAKAYGPFETTNMSSYVEPYFQPANYNQNLRTRDNKFKYIQLISRFQNIYNNTEYKPFKHYKMHHGHIPIWIFINKLTYGEMVHFYEVLKIQPNISNSFGLSPSQLRTCMLFLNQVRNDCAHFSGFYNQTYPKLKQSIPLLNDFQSNFSFTDQSNIPNIFLVLIILKYLIPRTEYSTLIVTLEKEVFELIYEKYIPTISEYMKAKLYIPSQKAYQEKCKYLIEYKIN